VRKAAYVQHGSQLMAITREQFEAQLDAGLYIPALIEGAFGSRRWMQQIGDLGGSARSAGRRLRAPKRSSSITPWPSRGSEKGQIIHTCFWSISRVVKWVAAPASL
jgi:hypothetical protein